MRAAGELVAGALLFSSHCAPKDAEIAISAFNLQAANRNECRDFQGEFESQYEGLSTIPLPSSPTVK